MKSVLLKAVVLKLAILLSFGCKKSEPSSTLSAVHNEGFTLYSCNAQSDVQGSKVLYQIDKFGIDFDVIDIFATSATQGSIGQSQILELQNTIGDQFRLVKTGPLEWESSEKNFKVKGTEKNDFVYHFSIDDRRYGRTIANGEVICSTSCVGATRPRPDGEGCIATGQANRDEIGDFIIQSVVGGIANQAYGILSNSFKNGAIRILASGNVPSPAQAPIDTVKKFQLLTSKRWGNYATRELAENQHKAVTDAITKQLTEVHDDVVRELVELSSKENVGFVGMQAIKSRKVKSISLGTAREYTKRTGKEIGLVYDSVRKQNILFWGNEANVPFENIHKLLPKGATDGKSLRLIWHTHPSSKAASDFIEEAVASFASKGDPQALLWFGNTKSFVIPPDVRGLDFIRIFTQ